MSGLYGLEQGNEILALGFVLVMLVALAVAFAPPIPTRRLPALAKRGSPAFAKRGSPAFAKRMRDSGRY